MKGKQRVKRGKQGENGSKDFINRPQTEEIKKDRNRAMNTKNKAQEENW
jgi:hypothetical protein